MSLGFAVIEKVIERVIGFASLASLSLGFAVIGYASLKWSLLRRGSDRERERGCKDEWKRRGCEESEGEKERFQFYFKIFLLISLVLIE